MSVDNKYEYFDEIKRSTVAPMLDASTALSRWRISRNPLDFLDHINYCISAWDKIKEKRAQFIKGAKNSKRKRMIEELDALLYTPVRQIPKGKREDIAFWHDVYDFLAYAFAKLKLLDVGRIEKDENKAFLDGF